MLAFLLPALPTLIAQTIPAPAEQLDLDSEIIEDSPVLQRWLEEVPDVQAEIRNDPSFRTRLRLGYTQFSGDDDISGLSVGIEDVFIDRTGLTLSADYQTGFEADRSNYGADVRYYVLPLGSYVNVAPVVGYRSIETEEIDADGVNVGMRFLLVPSRTGAADLSFTQSWVALGTDSQVSLSTFSAAYAFTNNLRLSTNLQLQTDSDEQDSQLGVGLEWMF